MKKLLLSGAFLLICSFQFAGNPYKGDKCIIKSEFIWQPGEVVYPSCHASTITETGKGLLAAWFGGTAEKNPDVGIWISSFKDGKWSNPVEAANGIEDSDKRYPCWNPVLYNNGNKIILFYKVGPSPSKWWGELKTSENNGETWSNSARLSGGIYGPVKNKPVLIKNGDLLCPSSTEDDGWRIHVEILNESKNIWERTPALNGKEIRAIQPTILTHKNNSLQMLCRSTAGKILSTWSVDNGRTWSELISTSLPNPNSGIDAVTLNNGKQLLVYNHIVKGRNILNVAVSDDGNDWKAAVLLENEKEGEEFSYPAVIQTKDGLVHITYTWNRKLIKHVVLDPEKIVTKDFINGEWPAD